MTVPLRPKHAHGEWPGLTIVDGAGKPLLQSYIVDGVMSGDAMRRLGQYADNVRLSRRLGPRAVRIALNLGPWFFEELAADGPRQQRTAPRDEGD